MNECTYYNYVKDVHFQYSGGGSGGGGDGRSGGDGRIGGGSTQRFVPWHNIWLVHTATGLYYIHAY